MRHELRLQIASSPDDPQNPLLFRKIYENPVRSGSELIKTGESYFLIRDKKKRFEIEYALLETSNHSEKEEENFVYVVKFKDTDWETYCDELKFEDGQKAWDYFREELLISGWMIDRFKKI